MKVAYVKWLDAYTVQGAVPIADHEAPGLPVESAGILLRDDKHSVSICRCFHGEVAEEPLVIPRPYILSVKVFDVPAKARA